MKKSALFALSLVLLSPSALAGNASLLCGSAPCIGSNGTNYCQDLDRDGVYCEAYEPNITSTRRQRAALGGLRSQNLGNASSTTCASVWGNGTSTQAVTCTSASAAGHGSAPLDVQVTVKEFGCSIAKDSPPWDSGDTITPCLKEMGATSTGACMTGTVITFNDTSTEGTFVTTPNQLTVSTADYSLGVGFDAAGVEVLGATDTFSVSCYATYDIP